jgi:hypothetical protein
VRDIIYGLRDVMTLRYFEYHGLGYENMGWVLKTWAGFSMATGDLVHMQYPHGHRLATSGLSA